MANLTNWTPLRSSLWGRDLFDEIERFFEQPFDLGLSPWFGGRPMSLPIDVADTGDEYLLRAAIPGIHPDDLDLSITESALTIRGEFAEDEDVEEARYLMRERQHGSFTRTIALPVPVDADKVQAVYQNGVLTLHLPKLETARPRRISITGGNGQKIIEGRPQRAPQQLSQGKDGAGRHSNGS